MTRGYSLTTVREVVKKCQLPVNSYLVKNVNKGGQKKPKSSQRS